MPEEFAFGKPSSETKVQLADNKNPPLQWQDLPAGTKSLSLLCVDPDAPSRPDDVNQPDREVPADLPRTNFFHLVLVDLPADLQQIVEGQLSSGVTVGGKSAELTTLKGRQGLNTYTDWFAGDPNMKGSYYGYDGPCPPWNDALVHRYVFTLYALDVPQLELPSPFSGADVLKKMEGHILGQQSFEGTYTLNTRLR
jgi:hypothetical protein